jgi:hypothetical protein
VLAVLYWIFTANKSTANTVAMQRNGVKKFLAKFNVLRPFTSQFVQLLKEQGFELSEVYDANKSFENTPLDKVTFYVLDTQLIKYNVLAKMQEVEPVSLLVIS